MTNKEVGLALADQINETYSTYTSLTGDVLNLALQIENGRIKLGTLLIEAKAVVGHGNFTRWIQEHCKDISERSARNYMAFSKANKGQPLKSLDELREYQKLLIRLGLKEPTEGHGIQQLHHFNAFAAFTKAIQKTSQTISEIFEKKPLPEWSDDDKAQLKAQLEPLNDLYYEL